MRSIVLALLVVVGCGEAKPFGLGDAGWGTGGVAMGGAAGMGTGGAAGAGGSVPAATGGTPATGGAPAAGGASTGGAPVVTGGAPGAGGVTGTGGVPGTPIAGVARVWVVGDSITEGCIGLDCSRGGWRAPLYTSLLRRGLAADFVGTYPNAGTWALASGVFAGSGHDGHSGISAARVRQSDYLAGWLPTPLPQVVLLSLGANDVNTVEAGANVGWLIDRLRMLVPLAQVFVATPTPQGRAIEVLTAQIIAEVAARPGVHLVDMSHALVLDEPTVSHGDYSGPIADNLHPSTQGYAKVAALWEAALADSGVLGKGGPPLSSDPPLTSPKPCDGLCVGWTTIAPGQNSGALSTNAVCHQVYGVVTGIACGNFVAPRSLAVNGTAWTCTGNGAAPPAVRNGGYCFVAPAGQHPTAYFLTY